MTTKTPYFIDALPYVDTSIDDDDIQRASAMKEVDDEIDVFPPDKDYLEYLPYQVANRLFSTLLIENEHNAIENNLSRPPSSDLAKLIIEVPPPARSGKIDEDEFEIWNRCLDQLKLRIEYGLRQMANLDLNKIYGDSAWEQCLKETKFIDNDLKDGIANILRKTQEVNWSRKSEQERVLRQLNVLQQQWQSMADRNMALIRAIKEL